MNNSRARVGPQQIRAAHQLYCSLTGQHLTLGFDRERMWFELLRQGHTLEDLKKVITYLQKEIRHQHRNVGALKLSNLLQLDRFEEDLNISRVRLRQPHSSPPPASIHEKLDPETQRRGRLAALKQLRKIKAHLHQITSQTSTAHSENDSTD